MKVTEITGAFSALQCHGKKAFAPRERWTIKVYSIQEQQKSQKSKNEEVRVKLRPYLPVPWISPANQERQ